MCHAASTIGFHRRQVPLGPPRIDSGPPGFPARKDSACAAHPQRPHSGDRARGPFSVEQEDCRCCVIPGTKRIKSGQPPHRKSSVRPARGGGVDRLVSMKHPPAHLRRHLTLDRQGVPRERRRPRRLRPRSRPSSGSVPSAAAAFAAGAAAAAAEENAASDGAPSLRKARPGTPLLTHLGRQRGAPREV